MKHEPLTLKKQARELRRWQTTGEAAMWNSVRDRRFLGLKFRRQHGLGRFVLDFFCEELALAIEMDGAHHFDPVVAERDSKRTERLQNEHAVTLIRIENEEMLENPKIVMARIERVVRALRVLRQIQL